MDLCQLKSKNVIRVLAENATKELGVYYIKIKLWVLTFYEKESRGTNPEWNISKEEIALLCSYETKVAGSSIIHVLGF